MEIKVNIDDNYIKDLQSKVDNAKPSLIASDAIALYNWAVNEIISGRKVVSLDESKNSYREITSPVLKKAHRDKAG
ncbi:hypothetical protein [Chitinophaga rhizophila]|uniref:CopG antitoxin of type II toxin-antitoxin system n=1 Tax=Chitinophaga rhizophila TaxID=2866212 RepID=A0ABS7GAB5_9BACT|nr:hypothetical protein [Chitinophaga rhizophila]MBW8684381.1 hypothetical protein [Chitinophaga rhizophila]